MSITDTLTSGADLAEPDDGLPRVTEQHEQHDAERAPAAPVADAAAEEHTAGITAGESSPLQPEQFVVPDDAVTHPNYPIGHRGDVGPATVVIGPNRRKTVVLGTGFVNSIKARGVLRRIHVYQDPAGHLLIEDGQRRTLGAIKAGRASVPFEVVEEPADAAELIYDQLGLNDHERMTARDVAESYRQLSLLGETLTKMARESGRKTKDVKGLLAVAGSGAARAAGDDLTLEQLLVIAEFDGDPDAQARLADGLRWGNFTHVAQKLRDARADREAKQKILDDAAAHGIPVVDGAGYDHTAQPLSRIGIDGDDAIEEHRRNCAGHAVMVTTDWSGTGRIWVAKPVCQDPVTNGHTVPDWVQREMAGSAAAPKKKVADMDPEEAEKARAERKQVRDNNLAWQSAVVVRREWLANGFVKRMAVPAGAELFIVGELLRNPHYLHDGLSDGLTPLATAVLPAGAKLPLPHSELAEHLVGKITTSKRGVVLAAAVIFYAWEDDHGGDDLAKTTWRRFTADDTRVLLQMEKWGYELSDVERLVAYPKRDTKARVTRLPAAKNVESQVADSQVAAAEVIESEVAEPDVVGAHAVDQPARTRQATDAERAAGTDGGVTGTGATESEPETADSAGASAADGQPSTPSPGTSPDRGAGTTAG